MSDPRERRTEKGDLPADYAEVVRRAEERRQRAEAILQELDLMNQWRQFGRPVLVGPWRSTSPSLPTSTWRYTAPN